MKRIVIFPLFDDNLEKVPENIRTAIHVSTGWFFVTKNEHLVDSKGNPVFSTIDLNSPAKYIVPGEYYEDSMKMRGLFDYHNDEWWPPLLPMPPRALEELRKNEPPSTIVPGFYHNDAYFRRKYMEYEVRTNYRHIKTFADFYSESLRLVTGFNDGLAIVRIPWDFNKDFDTIKTISAARANGVAIENIIIPLNVPGWYAPDFIFSTDRSMTHYFYNENATITFQGTQKVIIERGSEEIKLSRTEFEKYINAADAIGMFLNVMFF